MGTTTVDVSNTEDIIDSRDVIERISELEDADRDEVEQDELDMLLALQAEAEGYIVDWEHGEALIRDSYFQQYAEGLAESIGAIDRNASWPLSYIDWEGAADALKMDYTAIMYGDVTYWAR